MKLEIKQWPESQEVMDNEEWFFITSEPYELLGSSCYARIIDDDKYNPSMSPTDQRVEFMVGQEDDGEV